MEAVGSGGAVPATADRPLISGAERLRPDLWASAQALRSHSGWRCAQAKAACAEVELVHAGHEQVQLIGHPDRLNGTGQGDYNLRLSQRRAATVRDTLQRLGLPGPTSAEVSIEAAGDASPVQACAGRTASTAELQECLLPNRHVDVRVLTVPAH